MSFHYLFSSEQRQLVTQLKPTRAHFVWSNGAPGRQAPTAIFVLPCRWYCWTVLRPCTVGTSAALRVPLPRVCTHT